MEDDLVLDLIRAVARCPLCACPEPLTLEPSAAPLELPFPLAEVSLRCSGCEAVFPVTEDRIPILWSNDLRGVILESSALHHIVDWRAVVREACRIARPDGGVVLDSEPSQRQMAMSPIAKAVFDLRFPVYKLLSHVWKEKYVFRDTELAKRNLEAEIHHQPNTGFPVDELRELFDDDGFAVDVVLSPTAELQSKATPNLRRIVLDVLTAKNPWDPQNGGFTAIARGLAQPADLAR